MQFSVKRRNRGGTHNWYIRSFFERTANFATARYVIHIVQQMHIPPIRVHDYPLELLCRCTSPSNMQFDNDHFGARKTPITGITQGNGLTGRKGLRRFQTIQPAPEKIECEPPLGKSGRLSIEAHSKYDAINFGPGTNLGGPPPKETTLRT